MKISIETAKLAKKIGSARVDQSVLQTWLRNTYGIIICISYYYDHLYERYYWSITDKNNITHNECGEWWSEDITEDELGNIYYKTYEEALEKGLFNALELIIKNYEK
jgi:hypothetical protein